MTRKLLVIDDSPFVFKAVTKALQGTDYEVAYSENTNAGTASIKISGKGKYKDEITKTFKINKLKRKLTQTKKPMITQKIS